MILFQSTNVSNGNRTIILLSRYETIFCFFFFSNSLLVVVLKNGRKICCFVWCVVVCSIEIGTFFSSFWWWLSLALYCYFCSVFSLLFEHFHSIIASIVRLTVDIGWNAWCFNKHRRQQQKTKQKSEQK